MIIHPALLPSRHRGGWGEARPRTNRRVSFHFCARLEVTMPKRKAYDHIAQARKLRDRGEECRTLARLMDTEANAATYLRMADAYDTLAEQEEQLASDVVRFNLNH
jgi:hypothetical protein